MEHVSPGSSRLAILTCAVSASGILSAQTTITFQGNGDGSTDNQSAFNSAAATLSGSGGGTIHIPAGTYAHSGSVTFGSGSNVLCDLGAVIKATTTTQAFIFTGSNSGVKDCRFVSAATGTGTGDTAPAIVSNGCQTCSATAIDIQGSAGDGFLIEGASTTGIQLKGGSVTAVPSNGIHVTTGAHGVVVEEVQISSPGADCVAVFSVAADGSQVHDVVLSRNKCQSAGSNGIQLTGGTHSRIIENAVDNPALHAIVVRNLNGTDTNIPDTIDVSGNTISNQANVAYYAIGLDSTQNTTVSSNVIRNSNGIYAWGISSRLIISDNKLNTISGDGINFWNTVQEFTVMGNSMFALQQSCVKMTGAIDGVVAHNACWDARLNGVKTWGAYHLENVQSVCPTFTGGSTASGSNFVNVPGNASDPAATKVVNPSIDASGNQCQTL